MNDVVTIGDAMITLDPSSTGPMRFVSSFDRKIGGAELNFAIGCARLGLKTGWISRLGHDEFGRHIFNTVRGEGVDVSEVEFAAGYPTSLNFKEIAGDGSVRTFYYRDRSPTTVLTKESLNISYLNNTKVLHITGVFPAVDKKKNIELVRHAIAEAKKHGVMVSCDPNIRLKLWNEDEARDVLRSFLPYVDILLTGVEEAELLFGTTDTHEIIEHCKQFGITHLAIKKGEEGSVGYVEGEYVEAPAVKAKKVVDTVGAGDGFDAGFIYGVLQKWPLEKTLHFANIIGSMVVSVTGDNEGLPYLEDVLVHMGEKERVER
ncbi:sugar kinase [Bacillus sp. KH172YL63]|uniref:sugar kinase n=1 Tax=Bacillus sp. KH172YL63 TaxID=2709784 RepID=UPI0013E41569|nr:sugar kinase [Bacillus sp. KH172YL63]BCB05197.1 2-dehydro-3-deoxygluconokinase [Bacillus sp. KH172YL63]